MKKFQSSKDVTVFSQLRKSVREPYMPKTQSPEASSRRNFENPIKWTVRYNCEILEIIKLERHFDNMCEIIDVHNFSLQTWPGAKNDEKKNGDSDPLLIDWLLWGKYRFARTIFAPKKLRSSFMTSKISQF